MANVKFTKLEFSGWLSYATTNVIQFDLDQVQQLIGSNGAGKSTIAVILEETCYNKNSRGIKKDEIFNWNGPKEYWSKLEFIKDDDHYEIHKVVKSTAKVTLTKNGESISGHTATQTYKLIEEILECDFTTFSKLVYQSIKSNLDFLTATDANRKKFLIGLFDQAHYKEKEDLFKEERKEVKSRLDVLTGKVSSITQAISAARNAPELEMILEVPSIDSTEEQARIQELTSSIVLIEHQEQLRRKVEALDANIAKAEKNLTAVEPFSALMCESDNISKITRELNILDSELPAIKNRYQKFKSEASNTECPTCGTHLDTTSAAEAMNRAKAEYTPKFSRKQELTSELEILKKNESNYKAYESAVKAFDLASQAKVSFTSDISIENISQDIQSIRSEINSLQTQIKEDLKSVEKVKELNRKAELSNSRRELLLEQAEQNTAKLGELSEELTELELEVVDLDILVEAYGSKGIVSYKLESCVKEFEDLINKYLSVLTAGKFALAFELDATKLQVVIYNDGFKTSMEACSSGQQSRISIASLLAIRSLLSAISKVNINLLFLDEVISVIDTDGINTLVELLLEEYELNSIIVSHGYSHPLTATIEVKQVGGNSILVRE